MSAVIRFGTGRNARPKYGNRRTMVDGIAFDSKREAMRYQALQLLGKAGGVRGLQRQVEYRLESGGALICKYRADFVYDELLKGAWVSVVEDVKGFKTPVYQLKKRLMKVLLGIVVRET